VRQVIHCCLAQLSLSNARIDANEITYGLHRMGYSRLIKRYSAYYSGWCVAFGEHEAIYDEGKEINWLFGELNIGFTLSPTLKRIAFHGLLGKHTYIPRITVGISEIFLNEHRISITEEDKEGLARFRGFVKSKEDIHLCLTSHFCYPPGTRIITFTKEKPIIIMYKEVQPLELEIC